MLISLVKQQKQQKQQQKQEEWEKKSALASQQTAAEESLCCRKLSQASIISDIVTFWCRINFQVGGRITLHSQKRKLPSPPAWKIYLLLFCWRNLTCITNSGNILVETIGRLANQFCGREEVWMHPPGQQHSPNCVSCAANCCCGHRAASAAC